MTGQQLHLAIGIPALAVFLNLLTTLSATLISHNHLSKRIDLLDRDLRKWAKEVRV